jgi:hypothetical protein
MFLFPFFFSSSLDLFEGNSTTGDVPFSPRYKIINHDLPQYHQDEVHDGEKIEPAQENPMQSSDSLSNDTSQEPNLSKEEKPKPEKIVTQNLVLATALPFFSKFETETLFLFFFFSD